MRKLTMEELGRLSTEEFKAADKMPVVVILDQVRSGLNVGSVFRTCDAFPVMEIALCGYTATPPHRDVLKTALGATSSVAWRYFELTEDAVRYYKQQGYKIFAVEQAEQAISLHKIPSVAKVSVALVFGNEVSGVSDAVLQMADSCVEVPQWGSKHSLNISVCAGVVLWELARTYFAE